MENLRIEKNGYGEKKAYFTLNGNNYSVDPTYGAGYYIKREFGFDNPIDIHGTIAIAVIKKHTSGKVSTPIYGSKHFPPESDMNTIRDFAKTFSL